MGEPRSWPPVEAARRPGSGPGGRSGESEVSEKRGNQAVAMDGDLTFERLEEAYGHLRFGGPALCTGESLPDGLGSELDGDVVTMVRLLSGMRAAVEITRIPSPHVEMTIPEDRHQ